MVIHPPNGSHLRPLALEVDGPRHFHHPSDNGEVLPTGQTQSRRGVLKLSGAYEAVISLDWDQWVKVKGKGTIPAIISLIQSQLKEDLQLSEFRPHHTGGADDAWFLAIKIASGIRDMGNVVDSSKWDARHCASYLYQCPPIMTSTCPVRERAAQLVPSMDVSCLAMALPSLELSPQQVAQLDPKMLLQPSTFPLTPFAVVEVIKGMSRVVRSWDRGDNQAVMAAAMARVRDVVVIGLTGELSKMIKPPPYGPSLYLTPGELMTAIMALSRLKEALGAHITMDDLPDHRVVLPLIHHVTSFLHNRQVKGGLGHLAQLVRSIRLLSPQAAAEAKFCQAVLGEADRMMEAGVKASTVDLALLALNPAGSKASPTTRANSLRVKKGKRKEVTRPLLTELTERVGDRITLSKSRYALSYAFQILC